MGGIHGLPINGNRLLDVERLVLGIYRLVTVENVLIEFVDDFFSLINVTLQGKGILVELKHQMTSFDSGVNIAWLLSMLLL